MKNIYIVQRGPPFPQPTTLNAAAPVENELERKQTEQEPKSPEGAAEN